ncbi:MAG: hypothetical protein ACM3IJ_06315 [Candidatus Levyibacteriota bacterium]
MANIESKPRVLIAISGGATTADAVLSAHLHHKLDGIEIAGVMASRKDAGGKIKPNLSKYTFLPNQEIRVINPYSFKTDGGENDRKKYGEAIVSYMDEIGADAVAQLGFIPMMPQNVVERANWVINQHPGPLDPGRVDKVTGEQLDFGGRGMRGSAVTVARLAYVWATGKDYWTESTVHFVTPEEQHDRGKLVSVARLDIPWATPSVKGWRAPISIEEIRAGYLDELYHTTGDVQKDLLELEHQNVIAALQQFEDNRKPKGFLRAVPLVAAGNETILFQAKELGKQMAPKGDLLKAA